MPEEKLYILAKISSNVYYIPNVDAMNRDCHGYHVIPESINDNAGFTAMAVFTNGRNVVLAIKGTSNRATDIVQDITMVIGGPSSVATVTPTIEMAKSLINRFGVNMVTGHSLGGYIAEILATTCRITGASFCGPGVNGPFVKLGGSEMPGFQNIQFEHDPAGNFNCAAYTHVQWSVYVGMTSHAIDDMVKYFNEHPDCTNCNVVSRSSSHMTGYYYPQ